VLFFTRSEKQCVARNQLQTAADNLRTGADIAEPPTKLVNKRDSLATADREPDHGSMARMENTESHKRC